jgi:hypothetical protein
VVAEDSQQLIIVNIPQGSARSVLSEKAQMRK